MSKTRYLCFTALVFFLFIGTACETKENTVVKIQETNTKEMTKHADILGVNVMNYGADNTGKTDSTEAIQAACDANSVVCFPAGIYLYSTLYFKTPVTLQGSGNKATTLKTSSLTANSITCTADGWHFKDLNFDAESFKKAGAYIWSNARYGSIENCSLMKYFIGFDIDGSLGININNIDASNGTPSTISAGGAIIRLGKNSYTSSINISGLTADANAVLQPSTGITLGYVDVVSIDETLIIHHGKDLSISPTKGQFSALIEISNSCFDTAVTGMSIAPEGDGRVLRMGVSNTWFGANSSDGIILNGTHGKISGVSFTNTMLFANGGIGANVLGKNVDGIYFDNCFAAGNMGNGLQVTASAQNIIWNGGVLGATHELNGNVSFGFAVEAGTSGSVRDTNLEGNNAGRFSNPLKVFNTFGNTPYERESVQSKR